MDCRECEKWERSGIDNNVENGGPSPTTFDIMKSLLPQSYFASHPPSATPPPCTIRPCQSPIMQAKRRHGEGLTIFVDNIIVICYIIGELLSAPLDSGIDKEGRSRTGKTLCSSRRKGREFEKVSLL